VVYHLQNETVRVGLRDEERTQMGFLLIIIRQTLPLGGKQDRLQDLAEKGQMRVQDCKLKNNK